MKHRMSFFSEVRHSLLNGPSNSVISACVASLVFAFLVISCGPLPKQYEVPETTTTAVESTTKMQTNQSTAKIPESASVDLKKMPSLKNAFKEPPRARNRRALEEYYIKTRQLVQRSAMVTNCSFDILKAFVAEGWAPIVMIQIQGGTPVILPISHYDNKASQVHLQNPVNLITRRLTYKEFEEAWGKNSQNKCILITSQQLTKANVQKVLGKYLPADAFQEIGVRSR